MMPYKSEKIRIEFTEHDKRIKLTTEQKELIRKEYQTGLISQRGLAKKYNVSKKTIFNVVNPEKYLRQLEKNREENHSKAYYKKDKQREYVKEHRRYKQDLYKKGEIDA